jgi:hypothetical protein
MKVVVKNEEAHSHHHGNISQIKDAGSKDNKIDMQEVGHGAIDNPVVDISDATANHKTDSGNFKQREIIFRDEIPEGIDQDDYGGYNHNQKLYKMGQGFTHAEKGAGIFDLNKRQVVIDESDLFKINHMMPDDTFGDLIATDIDG